MRIQGEACVSIYLICAQRQDPQIRLCTVNFRNWYNTLIKKQKNIMTEFSPFYQGFSIGFGLIIAIGAQNAFVIKQGILRNQVFIIALTCALIDTILIIVGVVGLGAIISTNKTLLAIAKYGGIIFLVCYGIMSLIRAFKNDILYVSNDNSTLNFQKALLTVCAVSLLNPHLYLDNCVLIGTIGSQFDGDDRFYFTLGAIFSSFIWFFCIGYGARLLLPIFQKPISWKVLDFIIGIIMFGIAGLLSLGL
jgi:L-lysine exporter family protein LysE/ArgO